jgi:transcriptional regulator with GAF, ATPase, and Fis domain
VRETRALRRRARRFVFLDEIGEADVVQVKLLVIEERRLHAVGGEPAVTVVCAS